MPIGIVCRDVMIPNLLIGSPAMLIAQISDTHLSLDVPSRRADLERCINQINGLDPRPDIVVHTGDIVHDGTREQYRLARALLDTLDFPYLVIAGNKDNRFALTETFSDLGFLHSDFPFLQYAIDTYPIRLICLDTLDETSNKGHLCAERLNDFERLLNEAPSQPTAVFMHHPPYDVPVAPEALQFIYRESADACLDVLSRHDNICGLFCGHVHRPSSTQLATLPAQVMTAVATDLRFGEQQPVPMHAPLYTLHEVDPSTGGLEVKTPKATAA